MTTAFLSRVGWRAPPEALDANGWTALHHAVSASRDNDNDMTIVEELVAAMTPEQVSLRTTLGRPPGWTALHMAANGVGLVRPQICKILLRGRADPTVHLNLSCIGCRCSLIPLRDVPACQLLPTLFVLVVGHHGLLFALILTHHLRCWTRKAPRPCTAQLAPALSRTSPPCSTRAASTSTPKTSEARHCYSSEFSLLMTQQEKILKL